MISDAENAVLYRRYAQEGAMECSRKVANAAHRWLAHLAQIHRFIMYTVVMFVGRRLNGTQLLGAPGVHERMIAQVHIG